MADITLKTPKSIGQITAIGVEGVFISPTKTEVHYTLKDVNGVVDRKFAPVTGAAASALWAKIDGDVAASLKAFLKANGFDT